MVAPVVILPVLALGELYPARARAYHDADLFALKRSERFKIDARVGGGLFGCKESHRNCALYPVFILFLDVSVEIKIIHLGGDFAGELRSVEKRYQSSPAHPAGSRFPIRFAPQAIWADGSHPGHNNAPKTHYFILRTKSPFDSGQWVILILRYKASFYPCQYFSLDDC